MTDTFETIARLVARSTEVQIDPAALTPDTTLESLALDSLMLIELLFQTEEIFGIQVADIPRAQPRPPRAADQACDVELVCLWRHVGGTDRQRQLTNSDHGLRAGLFAARYSAPNTFLAKLPAAAAGLVRMVFSSWAIIRNRPSRVLRVT